MNTNVPISEFEFESNLLLIHLNVDCFWCATDVCLHVSDHVQTGVLELFSACIDQVMHLLREGARELRRFDGKF